MTQAEAVKEMLSKAGVSGTWVSERMGYKSKSTLYQMLQRKNITVDALIEIADLCGYKLTLQKRETKLPNNPRKPIDLEMDMTKERVNHRGGRGM